MTQNKVSPYEVLGIQATNDAKVIKDAYKAGSIKWHPDRNRESNATQMFQEINDANAFLMSDKKPVYDLFGFEGVSIYENRKHQGNNLQWIVVIIFIIIMMILDWLFTIHIEWLLVLPVIAFLVYSAFIEKIKLKATICTLIANLILYFIIPTRYITFLANILLYNAILLYPIASSLNFTKIDIFQKKTLILLFLNSRSVQVEKLYWRIFGVNVIGFSIAVLLILYIFKLKAKESLIEIQKEDGPNIISYSDKIIVFYSIFFIISWLFYYFSGYRLDWYLTIGLFLWYLVASRDIFSIVLVSFLLFIFYYIVPWFLFNYFANFSIYIALYSLIGALIKVYIEKMINIPEDIDTSLRKNKKTHFNTCLFFMSLQYYFMDPSVRDFSLFISSLFIASSLTFSITAILKVDS